MRFLWANENCKFYANCSFAPNTYMQSHIFTKCSTHELWTKTDKTVGSIFFKIFSCFVQSHQRSSANSLPKMAAPWDTYVKWPPYWYIENGHQLLYCLHPWKGAFVLTLSSKHSRETKLQTGEASIKETSSSTEQSSLKRRQWSVKVYLLWCLKCWLKV